jgi:hypothetical protein
MTTDNIPCPYCKTSALYITATAVRCQRCDNYVHRSYVNMMTRQSQEVPAMPAPPPPSPAVRIVEPDQLQWFDSTDHIGLRRQNG